MKGVDNNLKTVPFAFSSSRPTSAQRPQTAPGMRYSYPEDYNHFSFGLDPAPYLLSFPLPRMVCETLSNFVAYLQNATTTMLQRLKLLTGWTRGINK
jgi:hypothetical protein